MLSRRQFLTTSAAAALLAASGASAFAAAEQAEWAQNYDGANRVRVPRSTTPILSPLAVTATEEAAER